MDLTGIEPSCEENAILDRSAAYGQPAVNQVADVRTPVPPGHYESGARRRLEDRRRRLKKFGDSFPIDESACVQDCHGVPGAAARGAHSRFRSISDSITNNAKLMTR